MSKRTANIVYHSLKAVMAGLCLLGVLSFFYWVGWWPNMYKVPAWASFGVGFIVYLLKQLFDHAESTINSEK